ncbi:hypothetical protein L1887_11351 [Cichorium endivia]|nr:hypothetical protein L1887_11351 [Cichorium endivia]
MGVITTIMLKRSGQFKREIQTLEGQSAINKHQAAAITELTKLSEKISENDAFQELRAKVEKLKTNREDENQCARFEKLYLWNEDLFKIIGGNGLSNSKPEEVEGFLVGLNTR